MYEKSSEKLAINLSIDYISKPRTPWSCHFFLFTFSVPLFMYYRSNNYETKYVKATRMAPSQKVEKSAQNLEAYKKKSV